MQKILIIEDDKGIAKSLELYLENTGFEVELYHDGNGAVDLIKRSNANIIILDINLPWMDWIEIARQVRLDSNIPIVMLTARVSEWDRIMWLEIWADDYIAKPFSPRELLARINTILRRSKTSSNTWHTIEFHNIVLDIQKTIVQVNGNIIPLTSNEFDILKKIMQEDGNLVTRETLMTEVIWYDQYLYDRTIDTHIKNLRKKLWEKDVIITVRWAWYRLNK